MRFNHNAAMKGEERMSQFAISILRKSRRPSRSIVFVVLSIVLSAVPICVGQTMQQGISVNLPVSRNAVSIPDADRNDSLIVSVTEDGNVYLGTSPISPTALAETIKRGMSNQKGETLYIKADARTQYAKVMKVLEAARTAGVESALLTGQRDASEPGTLVAPKGFGVLVSSPSPSGSESTVLQVLNSGQRTPTLKINNEQIPWANLQSTLKQLVHNRSEKVVRVKADGLLPFGDVVEVTDTCSSAGAKVALVTQGQ